MALMDERAESYANEVFVLVNILLNGENTLSSDNAHSLPNRGSPGRYFIACSSLLFEILNSSSRVLS